MTPPEHQAVIDELTVEVQRLLAENAKLAAEVVTMRAPYVCALAWREGGCTDGLASELIHAVDAADPRESRAT